MAQEKPTIRELPEDIMLSSLRSSGISIPLGFSLTSSTKEISPDAIVSVYAQCLRLIGGVPGASLPTSLPDTAAERFKFCADIAAAIRSIGYEGDINFLQFLYPTSEESFQLLGFLVDKLSQNFQNRDSLDDVATSSSSKGFQEKAQSSKKVSSHGVINCSRVPAALLVSADAEALHGSVEQNKGENNCEEENMNDASEEARKSSKLWANEEDNTGEDSKRVVELEQKLASLQLENSSLINEIGMLQDKENSLKMETQFKTLEVQSLDFELLKAAWEMICDEQHSLEFYLNELNEQAETRSANLVKLEMQRNALMGTGGNQEMLTQSIHVQKPELEERLLRLKEIEKETEAAMSENYRREIEHAELLVELDKLTKVSPRKYYIDRVAEITKNTWKQDIDIQQILKEIREIQLESNSTRERLHRTYAVVEETVFRETKNDPVGRQVYRLLTSIHDIFEQIAEKILATDRARRENVELEKKLAAISSRTLDIHKLQTDLDSIRKENEFLEQQSHHD